MAYLALYRMFRPTTLGDVVRQEHIVTVLKNQIETGRIGHAYLFCGPRGTGKTSIAKIFAQSINCENPKEGSACGNCAACKALKDPSNLDITEIDAASNNGVDEMRDLREKVQYPPVAGKYKVYIIDEVHMLSPGAFNALLKTLEEPPSHAVFVLATTESQKIPATILSRCMRFDFKLIPQEDLEKRLRFVLDSIGKTYEEEAISAIARAGAGSVRDMLSVADTCVSYAGGKLTYEDVNIVLGRVDFSHIAGLCQAILNEDAGQAFERAENFLAEGKSVGMLLKDIMNFLNACAVAKTCRDGQKILAFPDDSYKKVLEVAKSANGHRLLRVSEIFAKVEMDLKYSASPRVLFETAVMKASMPSADYDIEGLIARISKLEERLEKGVVLQNAPPMSALSEETLPKKTEKKAEIIEEEPIWDMPIPPMEEPPPEEPQYFEAPTAHKKQAEEVKPQKTVTVAGKDTKAVFGTFLRSIRKIAKSGVLLTLCMDLDCVEEDGVYVLYTTSDTIYRSLTKAEHVALVEKAFLEIGVDGDGFALRLRGKQADEFQKKVAEVKDTFGGVKIEIK